ncbi:TetR family transcriptional regulator [Kribbella amoyensis]|uniref:TetR family transcriptional regulator n=1 Tax=Kribbella amoyensis TaxID=996641 RepID=A0A561B2E7_9ACTN|nr:TetR/AcrR family transcriptional regulator [Kribbella amoyensis]TWD73033.1 TetR family transcriptional regulator [Kribbella amoyensis]
MSDTAESGSRSRTRRAILDAAVRVSAQRRNPSLADIAAEANVARSTLHRYFADRAELVQAVADDLLVTFGRVIADAQLEEGPPRAALQRLLTGYFELAEQIYFLFNEPSFNTPEPGTEVEQFFGKLDEVTRPVEALIVRGQEAGVIAPNLTVDWIMRLLLWMVYIGWEAVEEKALSRLSAPATMLQTIETGILTPPSR